MQHKRSAPKAADCTQFVPSNSLGALHTAATVSITVAGLVLSRSAIGWLAGQLLLAVALVQWFILLHECGHETLFRNARMNSVVGRLASFFSLIPYRCWKRVHGSHHRWTGWQDLDPTTASLVPRPLGRFERGVINVSWRFYIPVFSILYRVGNYWNLLRLRNLYGQGEQWRQMAFSELFLLLAYLITLYIVGPWRLLEMAGAGLLLSLMIEDPLLLSQHTHMPQQVSRGSKVRAFGAFEQETFTRSLRFPGWVSKLILFHFDAHELHHMYPFVPGYHLRRIDYTGANEVHWWTWLKTVKRIRAEHFLFKNRNDSGIRI